MKNIERMCVFRDFQKKIIARLTHLKDHFPRRLHHVASKSNHSSDGNIFKYGKCMRSYCHSQATLPVPSRAHGFEVGSDSGCFESLCEFCLV